MEINIFIYNSLSPASVSNDVNSGELKINKYSI
jgi:hypothetical protein